MDTTDSSSMIDENGQQQQLCQTVNCSNLAKLRCPTCMKLNIGAPSHFCSQVGDACVFELYRFRHVSKAIGMNTRKCTRQRSWSIQSMQSVSLMQTIIHGHRTHLQALYVPIRRYMLDSWVPVWQLFQSPYRSVPESIARPDYALHPEGVSLSEQDAKRSSQIKVLDDEEEAGLRLASKLGRQVMNRAAQAIAPGVTTDDIDRVVHEVG